MGMFLLGFLCGIATAAIIVGGFLWMTMHVANKDRVLGNAPHT